MLKVVLTSLGLGVGLAMDACAVSMANGMNEPKMKLRKTLFIAFLFGFFQGAMPLIGYFLGSQFINYIGKFIPWIALIILSFLGGKMVIEGIKGDDEEDDAKELVLKVLLIQAFATSIDALSVGFTISDYRILEAILCASIVCFMTFAICTGAVYIGKKFGTKFGNKAILIGGLILIAIGLEIFITGIWF